MWDSTNDRKGRRDTDMRRVAVTGFGIVSSIGVNAGEVVTSLREARSGITAAPEYAAMGFRCQVHGKPQIDWESMVDRRAARFLAPGTGYAHIAMEQAIADAGLTGAEVSNEKTGLVVGSGGPSTSAIVEAADIARAKGVKRIGPFAVPKAMSSGPSATLSTWFKIRGLNFSVTSACATSTHCIGIGAGEIALGRQDIVFAGGCEEVDWTLSSLFDAMGAMSSKFNDRPAAASRAYDLDRDGFVIAGGAGVLVLEAMDRAKARGAKIYGEIVGYAANSDGHDMVAPSGEGAARCMRLAMAEAGGPQGRLPQSPRHGHAHRRHQGDGGGARGVRRGAAADLVDQVADRPQPGRRGRAGSDLQLAHAEQRFRRRERQHRDARPGLRRPADRAPSARAAAGDGDVQQLRLRGHQRLPGAGAGMAKDACPRPLARS